ncbi:MAG: hypothetical protein ACRDMZ_13795 [Solirubrobacteraceae bacterium]
MSLHAVSPDAPPRNVCGRTTSITLFSTLKWWGRPWMRFMFAATRASPKTLAAMDGLSFISFASWSLIRDLPGNGPPQSVRRLRRDHLFFEVSFNGSWAQYIDSSVRVLTTGMYTYWGASRTFPGPLPAGPFQRFFKVHEIDASHYHCAYPEATVTVVRSALELEQRLDMFAHRAANIPEDRFAAAWDAFLEDAQRHL